MAYRLVVLAVVFSALLVQSALAVGFQERNGSDTDGKPLRLAIWYPSDTPPSAASVNAAGQTLAVEGEIAAGRHPLVIISHGNNGGLLAHADTAYNLADAGYVVVAVAHNGNTRGNGGAPRVQVMIARPKQIIRSIDYMLDTWEGRGHLDPARIGVFGFSYGGYTSLVVAGAVPDPAKAALLCRTHSPASCPPGIVRDFLTPAYSGFPEAVDRDVRVKAVVAAAPAFGWMFDAKSLSRINIPVQLWIASQDRAQELTAFSKRFPTRPEIHVVKNVGHFAFARPCNAELERGRRSCNSTPNFDRTKFHRQMNTEIRAFFDKAL